MTTLVLDKPELIDKLRQLANAHNTTPKLLLDTAIQEFVSKMEQQDGLSEQEQPPAPAEFLREAAAFTRLKPELLKQYKGRVVAIYQEKVVVVGDDRMEVLGVVLEQLGPVPCYIEWVEEQTPRIARITSTWIA
jgi:predicted transcriptional regulator